jgi:hypothetical protein
MLLIADTHVHLYDGYDLDRAFSSAFVNLGRLRAAAAAETTQPYAFALFLAERHDCHAFERLREPAGAREVNRHRLAETPDAEVLSVTNAAGEALYLVAGRQIVTRERLEVLALATSGPVPDGGDILDTVARVRGAGGVPVLAWAPGKWLGRRGRVVRSVLRDSAPSALLVGDTSMRPRGWATPRLMREAARRGFTVVGGTDPLPFAGQEAVIGRYGIAAGAALEADAPRAGLRGALTAGAGCLSLAGRRDSMVAVAARLVRHRFGK